ncbi:MAG: cytochrome C oxidase subunit IV family protein [Acidobacteriota bacterium]
MSGHDIDIDKTVRTYMYVFGALIVGTILTVAAAEIELPPGPGIALALLIACAKGSLVVLFFMHLIDEKKFVYWLMGLAVVFFFFELLVPLITESNNINMG